MPARSRQGNKTKLHAVPEEPQEAQAQVVPIQGSATRASLHLITPAVEEDTVRMLEKLLKLAKAGELTGIICAALLRGGAHTIDLAGRMRDYPIYARGLLREVDDAVARRLL